MNLRVAKTTRTETKLHSISSDSGGRSSLGNLNEDGLMGEEENYVRGIACNDFRREAITY